MTSKHSLSQDDALHNGQFPAGDAQEPDHVVDASFDPAALERPTPTGPGSGPDPFDPGSLRLTQSFGAAIGVKKALLSVPVRKPDRSWFVRTHPEEGYRIQTAVIEVTEDRETYPVAPPL